MKYKAKKAIKIICIVLSFALTMVLAVWIYSDNKKAKEDEVRLNDIIKSVSRYESDIKHLENELYDLIRAQCYSSDKAELIVGFIVSEKSDMAFIKNKVEKRSINPVIVIDCTSDIFGIEECLGGVDAEWEIMLYAPSYSASINDKVTKVRELLFELGKHDTGVFLLRRYNDTKENINMLKQNGFIGYTVYHESPFFGQNDDGTVYFDYSLIMKDNTNITARLSDCNNKRASMIYVFDIGAIHSGELSEGTVTGIMDELTHYAHQDSCVFASVAEVVSELSAINRIEAENKTKNEERIYELNEQIKQLQNQINAILSDRNNK